MSIGRASINMLPVFALTCALDVFSGDIPERNRRRGVRHDDTVLHAWKRAASNKRKRDRQKGRA